MEIRQVISAARQPLLQLSLRQVEVTLQVLLHGKAVLQKCGHIHLTTAAELGHGIEGPVGCNSLESQRTPPWTAPSALW